MTRLLIHLLILAHVMLVACGQVEGPETATALPPTATPTQSGEHEAGQEEPVLYEVEHAIREAVPILPGFGDSSVEEKISTSDVIVRAELTSYSIKSVQDNKGAHRRAIYYELTVHEYLLGSGPTSITAVWVDVFDFKPEEIEGGMQRLLTERDATWDLREAIIFLRNFDNEWSYWTGTELAAQLGMDTHYLLSFGFWHGEDLYSIGSERDRRWLPSSSASSEGASGDSADEATYLLADPSANGAGGASAPTISLTDIKNKITEVTKSLESGDGSDGYKECVQRMYHFEQQARFYEARGDGTDAFGRRPMQTEIVSGEAAGVVLERNNFALTKNDGTRSWLEGEHADLFTVTTGPYSAHTLEDGTEGFQFSETFATTRPLIPGSYRVELKEVWYPYAVCDGTVSLDWTINVTAPEGITHELWLETKWKDGANTADSTVGTLTPNAFGAGTIDRIAYTPKAGKVAITVTPATLLNGMTLDFRRNDGTLALLLHEEEAVKNGNILTWSVPKPWSNGDELMVSIRPTLRTPTNVQASYENGGFTVSWGGAEHATRLIIFLYHIGGSQDHSQRMELEDASVTSHTFTIKYSGHYAATVVALQDYRSAGYQRHVDLEPIMVTVE